MRLTKWDAQFHRILILLPVELSKNTENYTFFCIFDATSKIVLVLGGKFSNLGKKIIITYFLTVIGHAAFHILLSKGEGRKKK